MIRRIFVLIIRIYQMSLSPLLGANCKYHPTCSEYAIEALQKKGVLRGLFLTFRRILRCHPFAEGGYDPLEEG